MSQAIEPLTHIDWEPQAAQSDLMDKINELIEAVNQMRRPLKVDHLGKYVVYFPGGGQNILHYFDTYKAAEEYTKQIHQGSISIAYVLYESSTIQEAQRIEDIAIRLKAIEESAPTNPKTQEKL